MERNIFLSVNGVKGPEKQGNIRDPTIEPCGTPRVNRQRQTGKIRVRVRVRAKPFLGFVRLQPPDTGRINQIFNTSLDSPSPPSDCGFCFQGIELPTPRPRGISHHKVSVFLTGWSSCCLSLRFHSTQSWNPFNLNEWAENRKYCINDNEIQCSFPSMHLWSAWEHVESSLWEY